MTDILKTLLLIIPISLVLNKQLSAQGHWKEITIIHKNGDTLHGDFFYKKKFKTFKAIAVRDKGTGITKTYTPKDIASFTIKMDQQMMYFKTLFTDADYSHDDLAKLDNSPKLTLVKDTIFAQLLLQGTKTMYYYVDNQVYKNHFLIETTNGQAIDLVNKRYYVDAAQMVTAYNQQYKKQLMQLLVNSSSITAERINTTSFSKADILTLVKEYNRTAPNVTFNYEYKEEKALIHFGLLAGGNSTTLKFKGSPKGLSQLKFNSSSGFNAGVMLNIVLPRTLKRWSFYNELLYSNYHFQSESYYVNHENDNWYKLLTDATIKASYVKLFSAARFQYPHHFCPFIQIGIVNGYAFSNSSVANYESRFYSSLSTDATPLIEFRKYEQSFFGGVGAIYKKIGLELRYERGNGMSKMVDISSILNYYYALLNYTF